LAGSERSGCLFAAKKYHGFGGALFAAAGTGHITETSFTSNTATEAAGAVFQQGGDVKITRSGMHDNRASKNGGAVYSENGRLTLVAAAFSGNSAGQYGGAIMLYPGSSGTYEITHGSTFEQNIALAGAAVFAALGNSDALTMEDVELRRNTATAAGASTIETLGTGVLHAHRCRFQDTSNSGSSAVEFAAGVASSSSTVAVRTSAEFIECQFVNQGVEQDATTPGVAAFVGSSSLEEIVFQDCSFESNDGGTLGMAWQAAVLGRRMQAGSDSDVWNPFEERPVITLENTGVSNDDVSDSLREYLKGANRCRDSAGQAIQTRRVTPDGRPITLGAVEPDEEGFAHPAFCEPGHGCDDRTPLEGLKCMECPKGQHSPDGKLCRPCADGMHALVPGSAVCQKTRCPDTSHESNTRCVCNEELWYDHDNININLKHPEKHECIACPSGTICNGREKGAADLRADRNEFTAMTNEPGHWLNLHTMVSFRCPYDDNELCVPCKLGTQLHDPVLESAEYEVKTVEKSSGQLFDSMDADDSGYLEKVELESGVVTLGSVFDGRAGDLQVLWDECRKGNETITRQAFVDRIERSTGRLSAHPLVAATCCRKGHSGVLCATCQKDWVKAKGVCIPCEHFHYLRLAGVIVLYGVLVILYWFKAWRLKAPRHVDEQCQSAAVVLLVFFFQTAMLLDIDIIPGNLSIDILNMDLDSAKSDSGMCLSTGEFYHDWGLRFFLPGGMLLFASLVCLLTRVPLHKFFTVLASVPGLLTEGGQGAEPPSPPPWPSNSLGISPSSP
jgi:hypothetical protein